MTDLTFWQWVMVVALCPPLHWVLYFIFAKDDKPSAKLDPEDEEAWWKAIK